MKKKKLVAIILTLIVLAALYLYVIPMNIYLEEYEKSVIIDKRFRPIDLEVSGVQSAYRVSSKTKLSGLTVFGINNVVYICEGIHDPEISLIGKNARVKFVKCGS